MGTEVKEAATLEETMDAAQEELVGYVWPKKNQVGYEHDIEKGDVFSRKIITKLNQVPREFRRNYIFRVDETTRKGHENHYQPILFSIGPYHKGKTNLQPMEEHKWQCLNRMIECVTQKSGGISRSDVINRCYQVLEGIEDDARGYYSEDTTGLDNDEFLEMLLLDGCFLVDTIRRNIFHGHDPLINMPQFQSILRHDMYLLENQLPFFVLEKLHDVMIVDNNDGKGNSSVLLMSTIKSIYVHNIRPPAQGFQGYMSIVINVSKLYGKDEVDLLDEYPEEMRQYISDLAVREKGREVDLNKLKSTKHLLELIYIVILREDKLDMPVAATRRTTVSQGESFRDDILNLARYNTFSVTELSNAGVKIKAVDKQKFYDIQFKNGTLQIPTISITRNTTEGIFRNLMAYENGFNDGYCIINDYVSFMDSLISSGKDVELLRIHGVIEHFLGDDEAVSTMFNKLGVITEKAGSYYYSDIVGQLKHHCGKKQHVWMAKLRSDYFSSPWAVVSVIAAFVLLVLTIIQTVYSPLSYYKGK